jgi:hypothetical protein
MFESPLLFLAVVVVAAVVVVVVVNSFVRSCRSVCESGHAISSS